MIGPLKEEDMDKDELGNRMKEYENVLDLTLTRRLPLIIRLDGKAFHSLTRRMEKPFDPRFLEIMQIVAKYLCRNIQNCKLAYTYSDEISLLCIDYESIHTDAWFGNRLQKIVSVSAAMASVWFMKLYPVYFPDYIDPDPLFDSRAFTLPPHEVCNYMIWRQQDCTRNSITALAQAHFSHKELQNKNSKQKQEMLLLERGVNWNDLPVENKRGTCIVYDHKLFNWVMDKDIPIFTQNRKYINEHVYTEVTGWQSLYPNFPDYPTKTQTGT